MSNEIIFFGSFILIIIAVLLIDLGIFSKDNHTVKLKEAAIWTAVWVALALGFFIFLRFNGDMIHGIDNTDKLQAKINQFQHPIDISGLSFDEALVKYKQNLSLEYLTGYLIEYALSIDNVFVMIMIFMAFSVEPKYFKRVLFWGILGAIIMRFLFIFISAALIQKFDWILYVFGGFLVITGVRMYLSRNKDERIEPEEHPVVKFASKHFSVHKKFEEHHFWIKKGTKWFVTPLFLVLLVIEFTDVIFAVDSVPAIFSVTKDPYIVFFSNIFAILGLRSLFFLVMGIMDMFHYLKVGLAVLLTFIGAKMIFHAPLKEIGFGTSQSLYMIIAIIGLSILASLIFPKKEEKKIEG